MKSWKIVLLSAGIPTLLLIALAGLVLFAMHYSGRAGQYQIAVKTENFALLAGDARRGQTVFLGDSITEGYPLGDLYGDYTARTGLLVYNRGISAETAAHLLTRLDSALELEPRNLVLLIGTNDLGEGEDPYDSIAAILDRAASVCPETNVILQAVYPVNRHMDTLGGRMMVGSRNKEDICALNARLETLAAEKGVTWLDLTAALSDENGELKKEYTYDGLHPTAAGYQVITEYILPLLK